MTKRAAKGGEVGANGEFYEGGKFINTVPENAKKEGSHKRIEKVRKVEIEPYVWVLNTEFKKTILSQIAGIYGRVINGVMVINANPVTLAYYGRTLEEVQAMADRYNAGERWL